MPAQPSVFSLTDPRKTARSLIADDELHFAAIADSLASSITDVEKQLDAERQAPGALGAEALARDAEIRRLTGRLGALRRYGLDLCLGKCVGTAGVVYIGRLGLRDRDGHELLVDWRSPAAEPFFGATHAHPMGLLSRRRYQWAGGAIKEYWDEAFAPDQSGVALDDQSAFIASLGSSRTAQMRDVLGTIAADQDAIIRAGTGGALVVDGGPGTGKTVVALHRAAYQLYADPRLRHGVLIVGPHEPYLNYVADVLPRLGEDGVQLTTVQDLVPEGASALPETQADVAALKASARWVQVIETAVAFYEQPPTTATLVETDWADVMLSADDWARAFEAPDPGTPHNEARTAIWEALETILIDKHDVDVPAGELRAAVHRNTELRAAVDSAWTLIAAGDLVGDLWSVPAYLRHCAPWLTAAEVRALQRTEPQRWTQADLPLLDAARRRLGDASADRRERRNRATIAAERQRMARVVDDLIDSNEYDDGEGLMTMLRNEDLRDALVDETAVATAARDERAGPFAHIVVDEAQELTDAQWQMLLARCPTRSFTVVGDRAQARDGFTESWEERLMRVGFSRITIAALTINYRTPMEVMAAAEPVIRTAIRDANVPSSIRSSGIPVTYGHVADVREVVQAWRAENDDGTVCVIGADAADEELLAGMAQVRLLSPTLAKGLEFDRVVLVDRGDGGAFGSAIAGTVDRYVAMTRATRQLAILR